jgi:hypothetical protein
VQLASLHNDFTKKLTTMLELLKLAVRKLKVSTLFFQKKFFCDLTP